jgi:undecaprenyl-diphosphatase
VIDDTDLRVKKTDVYDFSLPMDLKIGIFQCLAMIPGVSRSGATIVGAMLMGADKRSATEFSFYLAMPTMAGAFAKDLFDNYKFLSSNDVGLIVIGFIVSFFAALFVVRVLLDYVSRHGFWLFAWWRIIVGALGFAGLIIFG